jgi:hypothetical protein
MTTAASVKMALDEADREINRRRYEQDPWAWLCECVSTVDELDPVHPIKPFPTHVCRACERYLGGPANGRCDRCGGDAAPLGYVRHLTETWHRGPSLLFVPKARRMLLSWLFCSLAAWLAWSRPHAKCFLVSDKEAKSAELLDRVHGILERLPPETCTPVRMHRTLAPPLLVLDNQAMVFGIAEGADQLRQYTATSILADEFGTWLNPRAAFSAMKPTIDGGGRLTIVSTAYPGAWAECIRGELLG